MRILRIDGRGLTLAELRAVADRTVRLALSPGARRAMRASRRVVDRAIRGGEKVYGVTTGFGRFVSTRVPGELAEELQLRLLRSHACGVGDPDCRGCEAGRVTTNNVADASTAAARPTLAQSLGSLMFANSSRPAQPPEGSLAQGEAGKHVRETPSV